MKTLKLLMFISVFTSFTLSIAIAQPKNKDFGEITVPYSGYAFCGTEVVTGTVTYEWKVTSPDWLQQKTHWSLVGAESGAHYEANMVQNVHFHVPPSGVEIGNYAQHFFVRRDNVPVGFVHDNYHYTVNANGDLTVEHDHWNAECFEKP
jgi:hypothetical protein